MIARLFRSRKQSPRKAPQERPVLALVPDQEPQILSTISVGRHLYHPGDSMPHLTPQEQERLVRIGAIRL